MRSRVAAQGAAPAEAPALAKRVNEAAKRALDLALTIPALAAISPALLGLGLLVRIDSEGPVLFRQKRYGKDGAVFEIYKFRTMSQDAGIIIDPATARVVNHANDARHTRVGRILRKLSLDELPQLINVVKGDMSLVGPRPDLAAGLHWYTEYQRNKLKVQPGITGPCQVSGRNSMSAQEKWNMEAAYALQANLLLDLRILVDTAKAVVSSSGVYDAPR